MHFTGRGAATHPAEEGPRNQKEVALGYVQLAMVDVIQAACDELWGVKPIYLDERE